jgi:DNA processing protein
MPFDLAAHRGALVANGSTIAVWGSGVLNVDRREHSPPAEAVRQQGIVPGELPLLQQARSGTLPQRTITQAISRAQLSADAIHGGGSVSCVVGLAPQLSETGYRSAEAR